MSPTGNTISWYHNTQWHSLSREEQAKYYEKARQERQLHMQLYPGWSARDNYGYGSKKKKRKKDRSPAELGGIGSAAVIAGLSHSDACTLLTPVGPAPPLTQETCLLSGDLTC